MSTWLQSHGTLMWWLAAVSAIMFVVSLIVVPILLVRIPADYFIRPKRPRPWAKAHPVARLVLSSIANLLGVLLVLAGIAMLVLPGQGILAILAGVIILDFPGKDRLEQWIVSRGPVLRSINWFRKRGGKPPLLTRE